MTRKITLELTDELSARLKAKARNISLEKMAIASLDWLQNLTLRSLH